MTEQHFICELTQKLWKFYILEPTAEHLEELFSKFSEQLVMIGTGKSEYYTTLNEVVASVMQVEEQSSNISFEVFDYWQECLTVSQDVMLVYGGFRALQSEYIEALVDMDTRFSVLYRKEDDVWKILHINHSVPFLEQKDGEYYPKSLIEQAENAIQKAALYKMKSETDYMTGLNNKETFKLLVEKKLAEGSKGNLLLFDLDYFKKVNDTYGHIVGDEILKLFAKFLKECFSSNTILGRMSGDEFFAFEYLPTSQENTIKTIELFRKQFENNSMLLLAGNKSSFSVGIATVVEPEYSFDVVMHNADTALYHAKSLGRHEHHWYV